MLGSCPKCKSNEGYYVKRICRYWQYFTFNAEVNGSSEMYGVRDKNRKYCASCNKDITSYIEESKP